MDRQREEQHLSHSAKDPLNPELERGTKERQSFEQDGGIFPHDSGPRGNKRGATIPHLPGCRPAHLVLQNTFVPDGVKIQEEFSGTSKQVSCGLRYLSSQGAGAEGGEQHVHSRLRAPENTAAKRRDIAKQLMDQLRKVAEKYFADIIAADGNTVAYRERGKAKVSSIEEVREETLLIRPQGARRRKQEIAAATC